MKKLMLQIAASCAMLLGSVATIQAYEGEISLSGTAVACKGSSVWHESRYRVIGRCEGLVYPYETQYEYYTLWAHDVARDTYTRIDDIDRGYFEGDVNTAFDKLLISAEQDGGPRRPSDKTVATGVVDRFAFDKSVVMKAEEKTPIESVAGNKSVTVQSANTTTAASSSNTGSVIGRIITSLLVILLVVVGIVIAGSLLFRSRGSVSH